jgi:hypothetical protein
VLRLASRFARRAALGTALALVLMLAPLSDLPAGAWDGLRLGLGATLLLMTLGKALYDTLYYDHYWP